MLDLCLPYTLSVRKQIVIIFLVNFSFQPGRVVTLLEKKEVRLDFFKP